MVALKVNLLMCSETGCAAMCSAGARGTDGDGGANCSRSFRFGEPKFDAVPRDKSLGAIVYLSSSAMFRGEGTDSFRLRAELADSRNGSAGSFSVLHVPLVTRSPGPADDAPRLSIVQENRVGDRENVRVWSKVVGRSKGKSLIASDPAARR